MPRIGSEEDYKNRQSGEGFGTLREDEYVFQIVGYREQEGTPHPQYNPDGIGSVVLNCRPISFSEDEDEELVDEDGKPLNPEKYVNFFIRGTLDKPKLGFGPNGASKGRRIIWGAYGVNIKESLEFDWDDLIGKTFIGNVIHGDNGYEKIDTVRPHRKSKRAPDAKPQRKAPLVDAAKDVFGEDEGDLF